MEIMNICGPLAGGSGESFVGIAEGVNPMIKDSTNGRLFYLKNKGFTEQQTFVEYPNVLLTKTQNSTVKAQQVKCSKGSKVTIISNEPFSKLNAYYASEDGMQMLVEYYLQKSTTEYIVNVYERCISCVFEFKGVSTSAKVTIKVEDTPTPDYPIEIKGLGDNGKINVKTTNKNLFRAGDIGSGRTVNGVTLSLVSNNSRNWIKLNGTATDIADFYVKDSFLEYVNENPGTYTMSNTVGLGNYINVNGKYFNDTFTTTETEKASLMFVRVEKGQTLSNEELTIQVEKGSRNTEYEQQKKVDVNIPVSAPLYDGDYIEIFADGTGQIVRTMGRIILDGDTVKMTNTDKYLTTGVNYAYLFEDKRKLVQNKAYSNIGLTDKLFADGGRPGVRMNPANTTISVGVSDDKTGITSSDTIDTIVTKINAWLQSNPVTVVYELAEPKIESITAVQVAEFIKLKTFEPITHVTVDGEVTVRYCCNNDSGRALGTISNKLNNLYEEIIEVSIPKSDVVNGAMIPLKDYQAVINYIVGCEIIHACMYGGPGGGYSEDTTLLGSSAYKSDSQYMYIAVNKNHTVAYPKLMIKNAAIGDSSCSSVKVYIRVTHKFP